MSCYHFNFDYVDYTKEKKVCVKVCVCYPVCCKTWTHDVRSTEKEEKLMTDKAAECVYFFIKLKHKLYEKVGEHLVKNGDFTREELNNFVKTKMTHESKCEIVNLDSYNKDTKEYTKKDQMKMKKVCHIEHCCCHFARGKCDDPCKEYSFPIKCYTHIYEIKGEDKPELSTLKLVENPGTTGFVCRNAYTENEMKMVGGKQNKQSGGKLLVNDEEELYRHKALKYKKKYLEAKEEQTRLKNLGLAS